MKTTNLIIGFSALLSAILMPVTLRAEETDGTGSLVRYDRQWVYCEIISQYYGHYAYKLYYLGFDGTETVNGKTYHRLCPLKYRCSSIDTNDAYNSIKYYNAEEPQSVSENEYAGLGLYPILMRQDGDRVYMIVPDDTSFRIEYDPDTKNNDRPTYVESGEEMLLYDFSLKEGDDIQLLCGYSTTPEYISYGSVGKTEVLNICGENVKSIEVIPYAGENCKLVEGIGPLTTGMLYFSVIELPASSNSYPSQLQAVLNDNNEVIYGTLVSSPTQTSLNLIREKYVWEYVYDDGTFVMMGFDGNEVVDGELYHRFVTKAVATLDYKDNEQYSYDFSTEAPVALLRQQGNSIVRVVKDVDSNKQYCLYDYDTPFNATADVAFIDSDDINLRPLCYKNLDMYKIGDEWCALHKLVGESVDEPTFRCSMLQTIGPLSGGTLAGLGDDPIHGSCRLNNVYDIAGFLIYEGANLDSPLASIKSVSSDDNELCIRVDGYNVYAYSPTEMPLNLDIFTIDGRKIASATGMLESALSMSSMQPGLYIARVACGNRSASAKFTVK